MQTATTGTLDAALKLELDHIARHWANRTISKTEAIHALGVIIRMCNRAEAPSGLLDAIRAYAIALRSDITRTIETK